MHGGAREDPASSGASRADASEPLIFGPIIVARPQAWTSPPAGAARAPDTPGEFVAIHLPVEEGDGGDVFVSDGVSRPADRTAAAYVTVLAPRRFLAGVLTPGRALEQLPPSAASRVLQRYLHGLLALDHAQLCERQKALAATAVRSLVAAALSNTAAPEGGLKSRRQQALIGRIVAHVDAHLHEDLSADALCSAVGCSRSVLYRATAAEGGVTELVLKRRLLAIRDRLRDEEEPRSIAALAEAYRFGDVGQLNRRFKALFGAPPGAVRTLQVQGPGRHSAAS